MLNNNVVIKLHEGRFDKSYKRKKEKQKLIQEETAKEESIIKNLELEFNKFQKQENEGKQQTLEYVLLRKAMEKEIGRKDDVNVLQSALNIKQDYEKKLDEMRERI